MVAILDLICDTVHLVNVTVRDPIEFSIILLGHIWRGDMGNKSYVCVPTLQTREKCQGHHDMGTASALQEVATKCTP